MDTPQEIGRDLNAEGYLAALGEFRRRSDQKSQIIAWFERIGLLGQADQIPTVLAVGSRGGAVDVEMIRRLHEHGAFAYDAIDTGSVGLERFRTRCESELALEAAARVWLHRGRFESFEPGRRYDLVHFVHTLYSMGDLRATIDKAHRLLEDDGRLAIVCCTDEGINRFKREAFDQIAIEGRETVVPEAELLSALSALEGAGLEIELIPSEIDVSECFRGTEEGERLLSFMLQADASTLSKEERERVLLTLEKHCEHRGEYTSISQPMLAICAQRRQPTETRTVSLNVRGSRLPGTLAEAAISA